MRTEGDELDCLVGATAAIGAQNEVIVSLLAAGGAVQEDYQEIASYRATIKTAKIPLEWFPQGNRVEGDHVHLAADSFFYCAVFL